MWNSNDFSRAGLTAFPGTGKKNKTYRLMKPDMKKLKRLCLMPLAAALLPAVSCETIYDDLAPCQTEYRVTFKYDWNINGADAFHKEVKSVDLWMFTPEGSLVCMAAKQVRPCRMRTMP